MKRFLVFLALALLALPAAAIAGEAKPLDFAVGPQEITIGTVYNGTRVNVTGTVPEGSQVVVRFSGAPEKVAMKQKGKALGLLWMNMNTLHFSGVPKVFLVDSSAPLDSMGAVGASLGLSGLMDKIEIEPADADRATLLPELVTLKKSEKLYVERSGSVTLAPAEGGVQKFTADIAVPSRLSPGSYTVEVFAVKDGVVAAQGAQPLGAKLTGAPAMLADLAFNNAVWYGVLASIIAIVAGLCIGLVFQSKGAH